MATKQIKKTVNKTSVTSDATVDTSEVTSNEEETVVKKEPRKFSSSEGIACRSITVGGLYMEGLKTKLLYSWANSGDVTYVEYQDILAAVRSNSGYVTKPYFVIEDEDFIEQNPQLNKIYEAMYSFSELSDVILKLSPADMKATILSLPDGAKESIKHTASQLVSNKTLDSVNKIHVLDEIFGTELALMAGI